MPITASAKKALRQSVRRRARNLKRSNAYKSAVKNIKKLASAGQLEEAKKLIPKTYKAIDKAAKTGVIKKNKASRLKSAVSKLLAKK
ncbi:MAG: 30S ribosomal protein S20 [Candidatus Taylorbacteria bacterium]|nr:30S ribosomal protein S20 [Candidatus Taylorbacteria bacterium]